MNDINLLLDTKNKNLKWYEAIVDMYIPNRNFTNHEDYADLLKLYQFVGNDFSSWTNEIDMYCASFEHLGGDKESLTAYNPIINKFNVIEGEFIKRGNPFKIASASVTGNAINEKNREKLRQILIAKIEEDVKKVQNGEEIEPPEIDFLTSNVKIYQKLLYSIIDNNFKIKSIKTKKDLTITGRMIVYAGYDYKPYYKVCNPLFTGFFKSNEEERIEKSDYVYTTEEITFLELFNQKEKFSSDDLDKLILRAGSVNGNSIDKIEVDRLNYLRNLLEDSSSQYNSKYVGGAMGNAYEGLNLDRTVSKTHFEFKAFKYVAFLTNVDEELTTIVDEKFEMPNNNSKVRFVDNYGNKKHKYVFSDETGNYELEYVCIPRRYECTIVDTDIIIDYREVPNQPDIIGDYLNDFELSYKGVIINNRNTKSLSPLASVIPYCFQYMTLKNLMDKEIAKYTGFERYIDVDQIPNELGFDHDGNPLSGSEKIIQNEIISRKTGTRYYSSQKSNNGLPLPGRAAGVSGQVFDTAGSIMNLNQLAEAINMDLGVKIGVPPQREAAFAPNSNVADNQQALIQSSYVTEVLDFYHDSVWAKVIQELLFYYYIHLKKVFIYKTVKSYPFSVTMPDGSQEILEITPSDVSSLLDLGCIIANPGRERFYTQAMMNMLNPIAQGGAESILVVSDLIKALASNASPEEIHDMIGKTAKIQRAEREAQQKSQMDLLTQQKADERDLIAYKSKIDTESKLIAERERRLTTLQAVTIDATKFAAQNDIDKNMMNDAIEKEALKAQADKELQDKVADDNIDLQKVKNEGAEKVARIMAASKPSSK